MNEDNDLNLDDSIDELAAGLSTEATAEEAPAAPAPATTPAATAPASAPADEWAAPPKSWRQEVHTHWQALPAEVRQEVMRRESDILKGIQQYKSGHETWSRLAKVFSPYEGIIRQHGLSYEQVVAPLLEAHHTLATGDSAAKEARLRAIAKNYGLDHLLGGGAPAGEQPWRDPALGAVESKLSHLESVQNAILLQARNDAMGQIQSQVDAFSKDKQDFDELLDDIIPMVQAGMSLEEAYTRAQWANPVARERLLVKEREALKAKLAEESRTTTVRNGRHSAAKLGPTTVSGKPTAPTGSIDDTLEETLRTINSR